MSHFATKVPEVVVKPGKMLKYWSSKIKVCAVLLVLAVYVYFLMFIKTIYLKSQKLDHIKTLATETEKMMHKLHSIDQNLIANIERLDALYEDY